jgi:hypothetical protein
VRAARAPAPCALVTGCAGYHGFQKGDIVLLTDDAADARSHPTRRNILDAMRWLVRDARADDSLFLHCAPRSGSGNGRPAEHA